MSQTPTTPSQKTFLQVLRERYSPSEPELTGEKLIEVDEGVKFQFVGFKEAEEHVSKIDKLRQVSLFDSGITSLKPDEDPFPSPNIEELDLSLNLIDSWEEVVSLAKHIPRLQLLQLSSNPITIFPPHHSVTYQMSQLKTLVLNKTNLSWSKIVSLEASFPNLTELHLCFNEMKSFESTNSEHNPSEIFKKLTLLNLEGNLLSDWQQIKRHLGAISSLETLFLSGNPIEEVTETESDEFPNLRYISLARTKISSWNTIEAIRKSGWKELRLQEAPLIESLPTVLVARNVLIARLPALKKLNGSEISPKERTDAEIFYLKMYASVPLEAKREHHPLYDTLLQRYTESVLTSTPSNTKMRTELIPIAFKYEENGEQKTVDRSLPSSTTVGILKTIAAQISGIPLSNVKLVHEGSALEDDEAPLSAWRLLFFVVEIQLSRST